MKCAFDLRSECLREDCMAWRIAPLPLEERKTITIELDRAMADIPDLDDGWEYERHEHVEASLSHVRSGGYSAAPLGVRIIKRTFNGECARLTK